MLHTVLANCTTMRVQTPALPCIMFSNSSPVLYRALYSILEGGGNSEVQYV